MSKYTIDQHLKNLERDINNAKGLSFKMDVIIIGKHCCTECDKIDQKLYHFEDVLKEPVLPYHNCIRQPF